MASFEVQIPPKKRLDVRDALADDHGIEAVVEAGSEGKTIITVVGATRDAKSAIVNVMTAVGGSLVDGQE